jgi:predicted regulator of Ras-like GTPase activity (Roadblock/LC7/MglB family)
MANPPIVPRSSGPVIKTQMARLPEVSGWVLSEASGALVESGGDIDAEATGAVVALVLRALADIGQNLGIGSLRRASLTGSGWSSVWAVHDQEVLGVYVDASKPLSAFEKKLDGILHP